jgi:membrane associated rhomboid family serine protease
MFMPLGDNVNNRTIPVVGTCLLAVNLLTFAYECRVVAQAHEAHEPGQVKRFFETFGLRAVDLDEGYYLGLFTHMFLHADFSHLLGNMIVLWAFVRTLENSLGWGNFLGLYLIWGLAAGLAQAIAGWGSDVIGVGASGAIAGMIGAYFVAFGARTKIKTIVWFFRPWRVDVPATFYVGFWLFTQLMGIAAEAEGESTSVAWFAHMGGFFTGAVTMALIKGQTQKQLVHTKDGELAFVDNVPQSTITDEPAPAGASAGVALLTPPIPLYPPTKPGWFDKRSKAAVEAPAQAAPTEVCCSNCGTKVGEAHRIASNLVQCPNPACRRLTYLG